MGEAVNEKEWRDAIRDAMMKGFWPDETRAAILTAIAPLRARERQQARREAVDEIACGFRQHAEQVNDPLRSLLLALAAGFSKGTATVAADGAS